MRSHAFRTAANQPIDSALTDLGTLGGRSLAYGINDSGQVVGVARPLGNTVNAFLYSGSTMTDLGTLGGRKASPMASMTADRSWASPPSPAAVRIMPSFTAARR